MDEVLHTSVDLCWWTHHITHAFLKATGMELGAKKHAHNKGLLKETARLIGFLTQSTIC